MKKLNFVNRVPRVFIDNKTIDKEYIIKKTVCTMLEEMSLEEVEGIFKIEFIDPDEDPLEIETPLLDLLSESEQVECRVSVPVLQKKVLDLAALLLDEYSDLQSNNICNDIPKTYFEGWTEEEQTEFYKEYTVSNGTSFQYSPGDVMNTDFVVTHFLSKLLKG